MSRITTTFTRLRREQKKALIPFITAGDPDPASSAGIMHTLVACGADLIELGVPFSDPMADGPVIQQASERALQQGVTLGTVLHIVEQFRATDADTPVVLMGYLNPVEITGYECFASQAAHAGVDGVLIVDMPPEESTALNSCLCAKDIDQIFLISPTTTEKRIELISRYASGFVYYVSVKGVTGGIVPDPVHAREKINQVNSHTDLPVGIGFGIRDAASAASVAGFSDAVVIGSALVARINEASVNNENLDSSIHSFIAPIRDALNQATVLQ